MGLLLLSPATERLKLLPILIETGSHQWQGQSNVSRGISGDGEKKGMAREENKEGGKTGQRGGNFPDRTART